MKGNNIKLELHKLGELPEEWKPDERGEELKEALEELEVSDREILEKYKPADMAAAIAAKSGKITSPGKSRVIAGMKIDRRFGSRVLIPAAAAAVLALALILPLALRAPVESGLDTIRVKGASESELKIYRASSDGETETLESGTAAAEYDLLQLSYRSVKPEYGVILSVDGRGVVTLHFPADSSAAAPLETGGEQYLPFSYELDDAPGFETFYLITSAAPFSAEVLMDLTAAAAAAGGDKVLDIPGLYKKSAPRDAPGLNQYAVPIRKNGNDH